MEISFRLVGGLSLCSKRRVLGIKELLAIYSMFYLLLLPIHFSLFKVHLHNREKSGLNPGFLPVAFPCNFFEGSLVGLDGSKYATKLIIL